MRQRVRGYDMRNQSLYGLGIPAKSRQLRVAFLSLESGNSGLCHAQASSDVFLREAAVLTYLDQGGQKFAIMANKFGGTPLLGVLRFEVRQGLRPIGA